MQESAYGGRVLHTRSGVADASRDLPRWAVVGRWHLLEVAGNTPRTWATARRSPRVAVPAVPAVPDRAAHRRGVVQTGALLPAQPAGLERLELAAARRHRKEAFLEAHRRGRPRQGQKRSSRRTKLAERRTCCQSFDSWSKHHQTYRSRCIVSRSFKVRKEVVWIWALDLLCASGSNCKRWRFFGGAPPAPGEPESGCNRTQDRVMQKMADGNSRSCREQEGEVPHT